MMQRRAALQIFIVAAISTLLGARVLTKSRDGAGNQKRRRPLNIIVPYSAGGGVDTFARAFAVTAEPLLSAPVIIVNRPGSAGLVGAQMAAAARPDGNTIMITSAGSFLMASKLRQSRVNPFDDFQTISQIGDLTAGLFVPQASPYHSVAQLIAAIKAQASKLRWAHTGRGSFIHIAGQGFLDVNDLDVGDVPFKGGANVRAAIIGEQVDFGFMGINAGYGFENEMRALAVASPKRHGVLNDVPTFMELGLNYLDISSPIIAFAPMGVNQDIILSLETFIAQAAAKPQYSQLTRVTGNVPNYLNAIDTDAKLRAIAVAADPFLQNIGGK